MKILMLNYELAPIGGGAGNATYNIAKELVRIGHEVDILTSKIAGQDNEEERDGIRIHRVVSLRNSIHDCGLKGAYTYLFNAAFSLRKLCQAKRYDVLHYFFSLPTGALILLPGNHKQVHSVISLRGSDVPYYDIYNKKVHILNMILKPVTRHIWKKANKVVALSEGLKQTARITVPCQEMDVIPNGVETDSFKPGSKIHHQEHLHLITVSRLIERKGIDHLLRALSELNDTRITLLVVGIGSYEQKLKVLCGKLQLHGQVNFFGYCERAKLVELYNQSDVFVLPSLAESFGLVFAEAMACGLPVIGGRTGGVPDLIGEENGILVEPGNVKDIKEAIMKMLNSPTLRIKMGNENRQKVLRHYSWRNVAERYLRCYGTC